MTLKDYGLSDRRYFSYGKEDEAAPSEGITGIVGGVYEATPNALDSGDIGKLHFDIDQNLKVNIAAGGIDLQIGAVELKDAGTDTRANILAANTARTTATIVLATQPIDASGNVLGRTVANTARSTATLVDPVQIVDAAGSVFGIDAANTARTTATKVLPVQIVDAAGGVLTAATQTSIKTAVEILDNAISGNEMQVDVLTLPAVDTELAAAAALSDTFSNPTTAPVGAFIMGYDGTNWERVKTDTLNNLNINPNTLISGEDQTNDVLKVEEQFSITYQAAAAANVVIKASAGYLKGIICGAWVTNGTIEVSDHASDGDGNVKVFITMAATNIDGFPKFIPVNAKFATGICADQTGAIQVSYLWR